MIARFKDFLRTVRALRQAATLPDPEHAQTVAAARAGLSAWSAEVMVPRMIQELETGSPEVQRAAISALRGAGLDALEAVPALMAFFDRHADPSNNTVQDYARKEAAYAAEELMRLARQLVEAEERAEVQRRNAPPLATEPIDDPGDPDDEGLERQRDADLHHYAQTLDELATATHDPSPGVRCAALHALVELGGPYRELAPLIRVHLGDEDADVRETAASLLGTLRPAR